MSIPTRSPTRIGRTIATSHNLLFNDLLPKCIDGRNIIPERIPITNPPICAKLSIPGNNPIPRYITILTNKIPYVRHGLSNFFQFFIKSTTKTPRTPYIAPDAPTVNNVGENNADKILPDKPDNIYIGINLNGPLFSSNLTPTL